MTTNQLTQTTLVGLGTVAEQTLKSLQNGSRKRSRLLIVGLNVALKGPFPLVGESKLSRESKMSSNF